MRGQNHRLVLAGARDLGPSCLLGSLLVLVDAISDEVLLVGVEFEADVERQRPR